MGYLRITLIVIATVVWLYVSLETNRRVMAIQRTTANVVGGQASCDKVRCDEVVRRDATPVAPVPAAMVERRKNVTIYGNTASATLAFTATNVIGVNLLSAVFPRGQYTIDKHNCSLDYIADGETHHIALEVGDDYNASDIAIALSSGDGPLGVVFMPMLHKFVFTSSTNGNIQFLFKTGEHSMNSMCRELGFPYKDTESASEIRSPGRCDLSGCRFLQLVSKELSHLPDRGLIATVPMTKFTSGPFNNTQRRLFDPMCMRSCSLSIMEFDVREKLTPYEFNGLWWCMTLEITTLDYTQTYDTLGKTTWDGAPVYCSVGRVDEEIRDIPVE